MKGILEMGETEHNHRAKEQEWAGKGGDILCL